jgi:hypothetical protein
MEGTTMSDLQRETLGSIWRLCEHMAYTAEHGHVATLKAQFDALKKQMVKLEIVREYV